MLLHHANPDAEWRASFLASLWLKQDGVMSMPEDGAGSGGGNYYKRGSVGGQVLAEVATRDCN